MIFFEFFLNNFNTVLVFCVFHFFFEKICSFFEHFFMYLFFRLFMSVIFFPERGPGGFGRLSLNLLIFFKSLKCRVGFFFFLFFVFLFLLIFSFLIFCSFLHFLRFFFCL